MEVTIRETRTRRFGSRTIFGIFVLITVLALTAALSGSSSSAQTALPMAHSKGKASVPMFGGRITFSGQRDSQASPDIYTMDPDGSNVTRLTTDPGGDYQPAWSPDGSKIAFLSSRSGGNMLYVMDANGGNQHLIATGMNYVFEPAWSPDGSKIAFEAAPPSPPRKASLTSPQVASAHPTYRVPSGTSPDGSKIAEIYVVNSGGGGVTQLTSLQTISLHPTWSPDGSKIAFRSGGVSSSGIVVMNANGSNQHAITNGLDEYPNWSPDGTRIAFSRQDTSSSIWTMNSDGSSQTQLTTGLAAIEPAWSPSGDRIVFAVALPSTQHIYVVNIDSSNPHDISNGTVSDNKPDWYGSRQSIVYVQGEDGLPIADATVYGECSLLGTTNVSGTLVLPTPPNRYDRLIARKQVYEAPTQKGGHDGWAYRVWLTNIIQENDGSETMFVVTDTNQLTQTIVISSTNTQIGFNIIASVEYNDTAAHLDEIAQGLFGASLKLMDVTDGQMYFEQVKLYDDEQHFGDADFQFKLGNPRSFADIEPDGISALTATNKHIRMASPDDYGVPYNQESAYATMVHEFGHYAIGAYDEYYKFNLDDYPTECTAGFPEGDYDERASMMYDPRNSSEFCASIPPVVHNPDTAQGYIQGESVWETLVDNYSDDQGLWVLKSPMTRHTVDSGPPTAFCLGQYGATVETANASGPGCDRPVQVHVQFSNGTPAVAASVAMGHNNRWLYEPDTDAGGDSYLLGVSTGDTIRVFASQGGNYSGSATVANCDDLITITLSLQAAPQSRYLDRPDVWPAYGLEAVPDWGQSVVTASLQLGADPPAQPALYASQDTLNRRQLSLTYDGALHRYTGVYTFSTAISPDFLFELEFPTGSGVSASTYTFSAGQFHASGPSGYEKMKNLGAPHGNNPSVPPVAWGVLRPESQADLIVNPSSLPDGTGVMVGEAGMPADRPSNLIPVGGPYSVQGQNPISGEVGITLAYQSEYFCGLVPGSASIYKYTGSGWAPLPTSLIDAWHQAGGKITEWGIYGVFARPNPQVVFSDVPAGSTFHDYISWMTCHAIASGYSDGTFRPNNNATRGQISKMVANAFAWHLDPPSTGGYTFADVLPGSTFFLYIEAAYREGVVSGYQCGGPGEPCDPLHRPYFRPGNNVTRGQISKIISNASHFDDTPTGQTFEDVPPTHTFYQYTGRMASRGIINGYACGGPGEPCGAGNRPYFRPSANATRGQLSKMIYLAAQPR